MLWQLHPSKKFQADDLAAFLSFLPRHAEGQAMRHVIEVRDATFLNPAFIDLARKHSVAIALVDSEKHPLIADVTAEFVYARLQRTAESVKTGYPRSALDTWAQRAKVWADGGAPDDLPENFGSARGPNE